MVDLNYGLCKFYFDAYFELDCFFFFSFCKNFSFYQKLLLVFKKGYQLKDNLLPCVPAYSPRVSFNLTPLSTAFETVGEYLTHNFDFLFSRKLPLSSLSFWFQGIECFEKLPCLSGFV